MSYGLTSTPLNLVILAQHFAFKHALSMQGSGVILIGEMAAGFARLGVIGDEED